MGGNPEIPEMPEHLRTRTLVETVRTRIRMAAALADITHAEIASRMSKVSRQSVSRERVTKVVGGKTPIFVEELETWANALGVSVWFLLGRTHDPAPDQGELAGIVAQDNPG
jgi:transcriptional regulator with XRE-family HTH domain